jgi:DNA-binding winged helix-turn-helix (wHTH) protein
MPASTVRFGSHAFDPSTGTLRRNGQPCVLQAQPARLLALLLEDAGEIVTRELIQKELWRDTVVEYDQNINFAIRHIRVALGADARLIQTVPRQGYRFVGATTIDEVERPRAMRKTIAAAAALLIALASGFSAGILVREAPAGRFVYEHLAHPDRCPYLRVFVSIQRAL